MTRANDSYAVCTTCVRVQKGTPNKVLSRGFAACQALTGFFTLHRIKPHAAPLVHAPINSFEFHSCKCIIQAGSLMHSYSITRVDTHNA
ncbi:hypothetical protein Patl1_07074 [Pistacia atlantica]|uniref:Uncharacterized protein n=1 Tax=Pistacia atlantica TaxID=434234 RepID=A0ACC1AJF2_9ROSI|nr:hypothetical protein Patl1_07074 [Pistacia atlantica]